MKSSFLKAGVARFAAVAALAFAAAAGAHAQEMKIGFVNSDRVLREATLAKAAQTMTRRSVAKTYIGRPLWLKAVSERIQKGNDVVDFGR